MNFCDILKCIDPCEKKCKQITIGIISKLSSIIQTFGYFFLFLYLILCLFIPMLNNSRRVSQTDVVNTVTHPKKFEMCLFARFR